MHTTSTTTTSGTTKSTAAGTSRRFMTMRHDGFIVAYFDTAHAARRHALALTAHAIAYGDNLSFAGYEQTLTGLHELTH
jgi:hypothetical protein